MRKLGHRDRLINVLIIAFVIGVGLAVWYLPPAISYWQSSEVYKRYKDVEGVRATYIKDYRVNDTLTIGVTLLEATDSAGWEYLIEKFNIRQGLLELKGIDVWTRKTLKNHPEIKYRKTADDGQGDQSVPVIEFVAISMKKQEICVFHTRNKEEMNAVFDNRIEANL